MTTSKHSHQFVRLTGILVCFLAQSFGAAKAQVTIHVPADQLTIQAGIDAASDGDTVLVAPGTYVESIDFKGKGITVTSGATSYTNAGAVVLQAPAAGAAVTLDSGEPATATLNGFVITHGNDATGTQYVGNGIDVTSSSGSFTNNVIQGNDGCAVTAFAAPTFVLQGNHITGQHGEISVGPEYDCDYKLFQSYPQFNGHGIGYPPVSIFWSGNVTVSGNLIENNISHGLTGIVDEYTANSLIQNNILRNNQFTYESTIIFLEPQTVAIVQNIVYGNHGSGAQDSDSTRGSGGEISIIATEAITPDQPIYYGLPTAIVLNNTVFRNSTDDTPKGLPQLDPEAFMMERGFKGTTIANNIFVTSQDIVPAVGCIDQDRGSVVSFRNDDSFGGIPSTEPCSTTPTDSGNLTVDPQFVSPATFDLHTVASSPVVAAGDITVSPLPATDLDGKNRTVCGKVDMGVYQVHPQPPIALTSSPNPSVGGSDVTFTATLTGNCNVPTGVVTFLDGTTVLGTGTLNGSAVATYVTSALAVGSHNITATYPGDFNFDASTSNLVVQVVTGYPTATTLTVSPNPATAFQTIALSSEVSSQFGSPTGTVAFFAGTTLLSNATVNSSGVATATINTLGAGSYNLSAVYQATTNFATSRSPVVVEVVNGAPTTTVLTSSLNPSSFGQSVTFTAKVAAASSAGSPAGTVSFFDGTAVLGTGTVSAAGNASFSTSSLALGTHSVTAVYGGSGNYSTSTSSTVMQVVTLVGTSVVLSAAPNPANFGQAVTLTTNVLTNASGVAAASGNVVFSDQSGVLGSAAIAGGAATFTTSSLTIGTHNITASYAGGAGYAGAASAAVAEVIQNYDFALAVSPTTVTIPSGDYAVMSVSVSPIGGYQGTVALSCSGVPMNAQCVFQPGATVSLADRAASENMVFDTSQLFESGTQVGRLAGRSGLMLAMVFFPVLALLGRRKWKLLASIAVVALFGLQGCSGKLPGYTPPGTYSVTVTATDAASGLSHSVGMTVVVQ